MQEEENFGLGGVASEFKTEGGTNFIKGADFDNGLDVVVVGMSKFTPSNPDYGVKNTYGAGGVMTKENWFVKQGILKEGESFKYTFLVDGVEKQFDNTSLSFYFAFTKIDPAKGAKLNIKRTKNSSTDIKWDITELE
jgi:hypothetical protein